MPGPGQRPDELRSGEPRPDEPRPSVWGGLTRYLDTPAKRTTALAAILAFMVAAPFLFGPYATVILTNALLYTILALGLNVVVDVGHHDAYSAPRGILFYSARRLRGLPALFVGVRCPLDVIRERRRKTGWDAGLAADAPAPPPMLLWQRAVHIPGIYDLEVDTSALSPGECAEIIRRRLADGPPPSAFPRLAAMAAGAD